MRSYELNIFFFSVDIGDKCNKLSITNTSVAWDALRELAQQDSIVPQPPPTQTNRLKKIADMIRFVRRTSAEAGLLKVPGDDISYNDTFIVSVRRLFFELFLVNSSFLLRLVPPSVRPSVSHSVIQPVSQSVSQSVVNQSANQSISSSE